MQVEYLIFSKITWSKI